MSIISCSDNEIKSIYASGFLILDYQNKDSKPVFKLAAFAETENDVRRSEKIKVINRDSGYEWSCNRLTVIKNENRQWAGYTDFVYPENQIPPLGAYDLYYYDAEERTVQDSFYIYYPENILNEDIDPLLLEDSTKQIAVYSKDGKLLFFGEKDSSWISNEIIFSAFNESDYFRICISLNDSVLFLLPPIYKTNLNTANTEKKLI